MKIRTGNPLSGSVNLPGAPSLTQRAATLSALAEGVSRLDHAVVDGEAELLIDRLSRLGVEVIKGEQDLRIMGQGLTGLHAPLEPLDCGNSGRIIHLLTGLCSAAGVPAVLDGSEDLRKVSMQDIVQPLWEMGVPIQALGEGGTAPLQIATLITSRNLRGIQVSMSRIAEDVKTCLLCAGIAAEGPIEYREPAGGRDDVIRMLDQMGVSISRSAWEGDMVRVTLEPHRGKPLAPLRVRIPGDFRLAAYVLLAAVVTPASHITLKGIDFPTGANTLISTWQEMGADLTVDKSEDGDGSPAVSVTARHSRLQGTRLGVEDTLFSRALLPLWLTAAACADGKSKLEGIPELESQEQKRLSRLGETLGAVGVAVEVGEGELQVQGPPSPDADGVSCHGDPWSALSLAVVAGAAGHPLEIRGYERETWQMKEYLKCVSMLRGEGE